MQKQHRSHGVPWRVDGGHDHKIWKTNDRSRSIYICYELLGISIRHIECIIGRYINTPVSASANGPLVSFEYLRVTTLTKVLDLEFALHVTGCWWNGQADIHSRIRAKGRLQAHSSYNDGKCGISQSPFDSIRTPCGTYICLYPHIIAIDWTLSSMIMWKLRLSRPRHRWNFTTAKPSKVLDLGYG